MFNNKIRVVQQSPNNGRMLVAAAEKVVSIIVIETQVSAEELKVCKAFLLILLNHKVFVSIFIHLQVSADNEVIITEHLIHESELEVPIMIIEAAMNNF